MTGRRLSLFGALAGFVLLAGCRSPSTEEGLSAATTSRLESNGDSALVTWTCTGDPCPWGSLVTGQALVWPVSTAALTARLGYAVSGGIYLSGELAAGATISVTSGTAAAYVGQPDAIAHRMLGSIEPGQPLRITELAAGEVISVQSDTPFGYALTLVDPGAGPAPTPPTEPPATPPAEPPATPPAEPPAIPAAATASASVTWTCTGAPCPWGQVVGGQAIAWPATGHPLTQRLGYAVSAGIYLPAANANGVTVSLESGVAGVYAGQPGDPFHRFVATIAAGQSYPIAGLAADEVVSVQSDSPFTYRISEPGTSDPGAGGPVGPGPVDPVPPTPGNPMPSDPVIETGAEPVSSQSVVWSCTTSPCPWGDREQGQAVVWPAAAQALTQRLGYTVSAGVYLPAASAQGVIISLASGTATVYAGLPNEASHHPLATVTPGQPYRITDLAAGEVVSVQSDAAFTYRASTTGSIDPAPAPGGGGGDPTPDPVDPGPAVAMTAVPAFWRCNSPDCSGDDWTGAVISWPSFSAYQSNARAGVASRSVFSAATGEPLYPYMGSWANGCEVTATAGTVLIIEWLRGGESWRETLMKPGDTYVIHLVSPEDGAMIETVEAGGVFDVSVRNCTPRPLP